ADQITAEQGNSDGKAILMAEAKGEKPTKPGMRTGLASLGGLVVALGGIITGLILDGGKLRELLQVNAGLVVFGGTIGAVMMTTPMPVLIRAVRGVGAVFFDRAHSPGKVIEEIIEYATQARK